MSSWKSAGAVSAQAPAQDANATMLKYKTLLLANLHNPDANLKLGLAYYSQALENEDDDDSSDSSSDSTSVHSDLDE